MFDEGQFCHDYRIQRYIGQGKEGRVYRVVSKRGIEGQQYALKSILIQDMHSSQQKLLKRCAAQVLISHQNINKARQFFFYDNERYLIIIMDLCGMSLENLLIKNKNVLSQQQTYQFTTSILKGVQEIHKYGFIHKDLNLKNIFIGMDNKLKIGDFGSLKDQKFMATQLMQTKIINYYSSPQLDKGELGYSIGSDIWATGLVIMQMLLGKNFIHKRKCPAHFPGFPEQFVKKIQKKQFRQLLNGAFDKSVEFRTLQFQRPKPSV